MQGSPTFVPGTTFVREQDGIYEYTLDANGMQILLVPDPLSPVAGAMVTYHVGSRNEAVGYTGATHLLEHLMFKGSERFNKETKSTVWEILETKGALVNATTWNDRTNYYEVVPKEHLLTALSLEADRMRTARIREEDRQSEMTVVRNEFERGENSPYEALDKQIWATAFQAHPYHHPTIGWKTDIERVPIERLKQFYDDFYHPDNATLSVVGGFDEKETLTYIVKEFGKYQKQATKSPEVYTEEPAQEGERRVLVERGGMVDMVGIAHKIPGATHPDMVALTMLYLVLSDGNTSRLYRALIDSAKAISAFTLCYQFKDPCLFMSYATLAKGVSHEAAEKIIQREYQKIIDKGVTKQELARAKRSIRAYMALRRDGPYSLLSSLNEEIATGDWTRFVTFPKQLAAVTEKDIQRVAKTYLVDRSSTVGWFKGIRPAKTNV